MKVRDTRYKVRGAEPRIWYLEQGFILWEGLIRCKLCCGMVSGFGREAGTKYEAQTTKSGPRTLYFVSRT
jgi:hypothetical protein